MVSTRFRTSNDEAVKGPLRHDWVGEEHIPVLRGLVRYHHERAAAVAFADEFVEVLGLDTCTPIASWKR